MPPGYPQKNTHTHVSRLVLSKRDRCAYWASAARGKRGARCCGHPSPQNRPHNGDIYRRHSSGLTFRMEELIYWFLQFPTSMAPAREDMNAQSVQGLGGECSPGGSSPSPGSPPGPCKAASYACAGAELPAPTGAGPGSR